MKLCLIGLGGLGTAIINSLTEKSGVRLSHIFLIDIDTVELCNTANQLYTESDIGKYKVYATKERLLNKKYKGIIHTYIIDINNPISIPQDILHCDLYISALDTYESRVNFYYYVVQESFNPNKMYIDTGTERFKGHCFFSKGVVNKPCIYCIKWLFPNPNKPVPLCSIRNNTPQEITEETKPLVIMNILRGVLSDSSVGCTDKYTETAKIYNNTYNTVGNEIIDSEYIKSIEKYLEIEPNTPITSFIMANIVVRIIHKVPKGNFLIYSGDGIPSFYLHTLQADPLCLLCS
ncbi:hypothetical protein NEIG_02469 [Nematocida sp. ERTm5]|nr:hypothetical protein NEIG_02469 [Nematocida sp. ERTm5]